MALHSPTNHILSFLLVYHLFTGQTADLKKVFVPMGQSHKLHFAKFVIGIFPIFSQTLQICILFCFNFSEAKIISLLVQHQEMVEVAAKVQQVLWFRCNKNYLK